MSSDIDSLTVPQPLYFYRTLEIIMFAYPFRIEPVYPPMGFEIELFEALPKDPKSESSPELLPGRLPRI